MGHKILVIGSSNTDMVIKSKHLPRPGETVVGGTFLMNPGGKGANQAVAAAKLGGEVIFVAKVGTDVFGKEAVASLKSYGINTDYVIEDPVHASGIALIMVDSYAENCISVALGANANLQPSDLSNIDHWLNDASFILVQLEIPLLTVEYIIEKAKKKDVKIILNPAPAQELSDHLLNGLDFITPNETEAELLTGIRVVDLPSARKASNILIEKGVKCVIITMGSHGVYVKDHTLDQMIPSFKVKAIDTTAAGDTFNGAFCTAMSEGMNIVEAIDLANQAAALSVTKMGAQSSIPYRDQINNS